MTKHLRPSPKRDAKSRQSVTNERGAYSDPACRIVDLVINDPGTSIYRGAFKAVHTQKKGPDVVYVNDDDPQVLAAKRFVEPSLDPKKGPYRVGDVFGQIAGFRGVGGARRARKATRFFKIPSVATAEDDGYRALAERVLKEISASTSKQALEFLVSAFAKVSVEARESAAAKLATAEKAVRVSKPTRAEKAVEAPVDPLAAARARGRRIALEVYESPDNLGLLDARDYAGRNERSINEQRQKGELYALLPPGKTRGFRYPKWQFDAEPDRLKAVLRPFVEANSSCWVIHSFMVTARDVLGGKAPLTIVLDVNEDVKRVADLAVQDLVGDQGAM